MKNQKNNLCRIYTKTTNYNYGDQYEQLFIELIDNSDRSARIVLRWQKNLTRDEEYLKTWYGLNVDINLSAFDLVRAEKNIKAIIDLFKREGYDLTPHYMVEKLNLIQSFFCPLENRFVPHIESAWPVFKFTQANGQTWSIKHFENIDLAEKYFHSENKHRSNPDVILTNYIQVWRDEVPKHASY